VPPSEAETESRARPSASESYNPRTSPTVDLETSTFQPLSSTESSRRSRRRSVEPLDIERRTMAARAADAADAGAQQPPAASASAPATTVAKSDAGRSEMQPPRVNRSQPPAEKRGNWRAAGPAGRGGISSRRNASADRSEQITAPSPQQTPETNEKRQPANPLPTLEAPRAAEDTRVAEATPAAPRRELEATEIDWRPAPTSRPTSAPELPVAQLPGGTRAETVSEQRRQLPVRSEPTPPGPAAALPPSDSQNDQQAGDQVDEQAIAPGPTPLKRTTRDLGVTSHPTTPTDARRAAAVNDTPINITSEIPGIRVVTTGPRDIPVRQTTIYQITVENRGSQDAPGAAIQIKLPPWIKVEKAEPSRGEIAREQIDNAQQLLWIVEGLGGDRRETVALHLSAQRAEAFQVDVEWAVVPQTSSATIEVREPKLQLVIEGPEQVIYGESKTYIVRVINPGNGVAENVAFTLSPNSATPQTQQVDAIPPGREAKFEVELTARDLENLQIHGLATADLNLKQEAIKDIQVVAAQLQATLSGPPLQYQDAVAEYTVELTNTGDAACENIAAEIELPAGIVYQGGIEGAAHEGNRVRWTVDRLAPDGNREFVFACQMQRTGDQQIRFRSKGSAAGAATVSFATRVEALADLVLSINDPPAPAPVDEEVVYEIVIHNRGSKAASDVVALAQFSNDIEPVRIEGGKGTIEPGQVKFEPLAKLPAGETVRIRVVAKAEKVGLHRFRSEVQAGDTVLVAEEATRYMETVGQRVSRSSQPNSPRQR
jgi:hypothetical protein